MNAYATQLASMHAILQPAAPPLVSHLDMSFTEFQDHFDAEVTKAQTEAPDVSAQRLAILKANVARLAKADSWTSSQSLPVQLYVDPAQYQHTETQLPQATVPPVQPAVTYSPNAAAVLGKAMVDMNVALSLLNKSRSPEPALAPVLPPTVSWPYDLAAKL